MAVPTLSGFSHRVVVGIADLAVSNNPMSMLSTYSLGSCVGVSIYDPKVRVGGLLHAMLPDSRIDAHKAASQPAMFVDTGIPLLIQSACQLRADRQRLTVCVAGGAQIMDSTGYFNIGRRTCDMVARVLQELGLRVLVEHVGGLVTRSLYLDIATGEVRLKISGQSQELVLCKSLTTT
jgi:chemotaxis protein CheD